MDLHAPLAEGPRYLGDVAAMAAQEREKLLAEAIAVAGGAELRSTPAHAFGKVIDLDRRARTDRERDGEGMLELAHVQGPPVAEEGQRCFRRDAQLFASPGRELAQERRQEEAEVFASLAQRR